MESLCAKSSFCSARSPPHSQIWDLCGAAPGQLGAWDLRRVNQIQGFLASSPAHAGPLLCRRQGGQGKNHRKTSYRSSWFLSWFDKLEWAFSQNLSPLLPRAVEQGAGWPGSHFWRLRKCSGRDWGLSYDFRSAPPDPPCLILLPNNSSPYPTTNS